MHKPVYHICKAFCALVPKPCTTSSCTLSPSWMYSHRGLPWTVQRCADCIVINLGWMQDVWAPCTTWYSVGYGLCVLHGNGQYHAAGWWLPWVCLDIWLWSWYSTFEEFDSNVLHSYMMWSPESEVPHYRRMQ